MKSLLLVCYLFLTTALCAAPALYVQTFGDAKDTPLIFLHGGPGYNCAAFEFTTAEVLATQGFYVVVYDRRGEGRSEDATAAFTFEESMNDLKQLYQQLHLKKAILLGHSFGGILAIRYAERYPKRVQGIILTGAPMDFQATLTHIRTTSTALYEEKEDNGNLYYMNLLKQMNPHSMDYASYCFAHALQNGFYAPAEATSEAQTIYQLFSTNKELKQYATSMNQEAPLRFWKNEQYTSLNLWPNLEELVQKGLPVLGLYGQEDGLLPPKEIEQLKNLLGTEALYYWKDCSHNAFIDQQKLFISSLKKWSSSNE